MTSWNAATAQRAEPGTLTVGVAVAIPEPFAERLQECRRAAGDPLADAVPPHITLVPPLTIAEVDLAEVNQHLLARAGGVGAFRLLLHGTGSFRPVSDVVFVSVAEGADSCDVLQQRLRQGLLHRELQFPYHPHVTVAHDVPGSRLDDAQARLADFEADFRVDRVSLYLEDDGVWVPVLDVPLGAGAGS